jgi:hypothetical protein
VGRFRFRRGRRREAQARAKAKKFAYEETTEFYVRSRIGSDRVDIGWS